MNIGFEIRDNFDAEEHDGMWIDFNLGIGQYTFTLLRLDTEGAALPDEETLQALKEQVVATAHDGVLKAGRLAIIASYFVAGLIADIGGMKAPAPINTVGTDSVVN